jgi:hypothetical protein
MPIDVRSAALAVARLQHWHIPRALGAAVILVAVLGGLGSMVYSLGDETGL